MKFLKKTIIITLLGTGIYPINSLFAMMDPSTPDRGLTASLLKTSGAPRSNPSSPGRLSLNLVVDEATPLTGGAITVEADRLVKKLVFTTNSMSVRRREHYTSLALILDTHDEIGRLVQSARSSGDKGLRNTALISSEAFTDLQKLEKALRKMIHLTWGALMLEGEDLERFRAVKSAPFLYDKRGFEGTYKSFGRVKETKARPVTVYSFPDSGDTYRYVRQIREIATELGIDLTANINLHFHPVEKKFRKKMAEAYHEEFPDTSVEEAYLCMLKIIRFRPENPLITPGVSPVLTDEGEDGFGIAGTPKITPGRRTPATSFASVSPDEKFSTDLPAIRNKIKFNLFMDETIAASIDGGRTRQLILNIVNRLSGIVAPPTFQARTGTMTPRQQTDSKAGDDDIGIEWDPFTHPAFVSIPYNTPLKPTTTAAYRASEAVLRAYWERTEAALTNAERIIRSDRDANARANLDDLVYLVLEERVRNLVAYTLLSIQNCKSREATWSPLVSYMLPKLNIPRGIGNVTYPWTTREISETEKLLPVKRDHTMSNVFSQYPLGTSDTEVGIHILEALTAEFER